MSQNFLGKLNNPYSKCAGKIIRFHIKLTIFGIIFEKKNLIQKDPLSLFLKGPIHKNSPAFICYINCFEKIYFHGICALSNKNI